MMIQECKALALGQFGPEEAARLDRAAEASAFVLHKCSEAGEAWRWLGENQPHAMLVDTLSVEPESIAMRARAEARHAQVPVLALSREVGDLEFAAAFAWGADDLVLSSDEHALVGRLRRLPREAPVAPEVNRGQALVAEKDPVRRLLLGRVLRNAGYQITFAVTEEDARHFAGSPEFEVLILSTELLGDPGNFESTVRDATSKANRVIFAPPKDLKALSESLHSVPGALVADGFAPPENVLFLSNELRNGHRTNQRQSPRILYGTTVLFRGAGRHHDDSGYSYNISEGGLYVRTLFPPEDDTVWLELCPPRSDRRVRIEGQVAWRRLFKPQAGATVPPGFGLQITDATKADLLAWKEGYESVRRALT